MTSPGLVRVHRWVALGLGLLVLVMTLTGASLVFRDELTARFTPAVKVAATDPGPGSFERIFAAARKAVPDARSIEIEPARRAGRAAEVMAQTPSGWHYLFVDPHDGAVVADGDRQWLPFATLFELHMRFMAGAAGEYVVALAGAALLFLGASGVILWWPRKLKQAFRIRWGGNRLAVSFDLHRSLGAAFALFLVVNATTGLLMNLDALSVPLVNRLARSPDEPAIPPAHSNAFTAARPLDDIVAAADRAAPGGFVSRVVVSNDDDAPVVVRKVLPGDQATKGMNRIYVDAASATVLRASLLKRLPPGNAMFEWLYPLHTGKLVGTPYKLVLILAGLMPLVSLVTGFIVWRSRPRRKGAPARAGALRTLGTSPTSDQAGR
jgi:uncharacterized iron-regulated membrane protein